MNRSAGTAIQTESQKQVAVLISPDWPGSAASLAGIMEYAEKKKDWHILNLPPGFTGGPEALWEFKADGALAYVSSEAEADVCRRRNLPIVSLGSAHLKPGVVPRVILDNDTVGREAASHFITRRFRRLGLICSEGSLDTEFRRHGFICAATEADASVDVLELPTRFCSWGDWQAAITRLEEWLSGLTYPVGIAASNDTQAREVLLACRNLNLRVPNDVAVLGVGNNERICTYAKPKISSVAIPGHKIGFQAAQLLDRLMDGEALPDTDVLIPPGNVVARHSSRVLGIDNVHVLKAVSHINANAGEAFGVDHLVSLVPVSRRTLETLFREDLDCTPHQYLSRVRVDKAKTLLKSGSRKKLQDVAIECGFSSSKHLREVFEAHTGQKPKDYRRTETPVVDLLAVP
ncbi:MAG: substrate-binding domain-containing protein [Kiritimatiellae bacterium]|nr:substrate-binding domain-containing protein [Kiritimatiellia bacterium]